MCVWWFGEGSILTPSGAQATASARTPIPGAANPAEADTRLAPRVPPLALGRPPSPPPGLDVSTLADPVNGDVLPTTPPAAAAAGDDVAAASNAAQLEPPAPLPPPPARSEGEEEVAPECPPAETATPGLSPP